MDEIIQQYNADVSIEAEGVTAYYQIFLMRTDAAALQAIEEYFANGLSKTAIKTEHGELLAARAYARKRIEELQNE